METQPNSAGRGPLAACEERSADPLDFCMEWNAEDQLTRVTKDGAEVARYRYDPLGRRLEKVAGGKTYRYLYDGVDILKETITEGTNTTTHAYVHGPGMDEPLARQEGEGNWTYYHADGLGSIVKTTDTSGAVVASYDYDAWGNLMAGSATPDPYGFTGREWDEPAQLWFYRARYYSARDGRFVSEDPIGFWGGINFYAYVDNSPVRYADPWGWTKQDPFYGPQYKDPGFREFLEKNKKDWGYGKGDRVSKEDMEDIYNQWDAEGKPGREKENKCVGLDLDPILAPMTQLIVGYVIYQEVVKDMVNRIGQTLVPTPTPAVPGVPPPVVLPPWWLIMP